mmetsp:Transcript_4695/g.6098  ORF Transcript_4695/g.6098 Transcript_4695/m.6098 type:complete len:299 (-) Transcript_4695:8-904(-)
MKLYLGLTTYLLLFRCGFSFFPAATQRHSLRSCSALASSTTGNLGLTPELEKITNAFESIGDDKLRYKQLLYMANQLTPMDPGSMIPENKVTGCLSTVYVDGEVVGKDRVIEFTGDSDGLLTKGLVALLVRGLSGNTAENIQNVDPAFIIKAGIQSSLTPGRNNGLLNMLSSMKKKALQLDSQNHAEATCTEDPEEGANEASNSSRPMYDGIISALQKLKPTFLDLADVSHRHAGHAGMNGVEANESHFELSIVAEAFENLNLVKRHQLVYMLLGDIMPKIHALEINANTPEEISARK